MTCQMIHFCLNQFPCKSIIFWIIWLIWFSYSRSGSYHVTTQTNLKFMYSLQLEDWGLSYELGCSHILNYKICLLWLLLGSNETYRGIFIHSRIQNFKSRSLLNSNWGCSFSTFISYMHLIFMSNSVDQLLQHRII